jgi:acetyl-CoA carboxylase biotin carboxyl carrier protein
MDFKQIQELIRMVNDSNIGEVSIEQKDFKITVRQKEEQIAQIMGSSLPAQNYQYPQQQHQLQQPSTSSLPAPDAGKSKEDKSETAAENANYITIKSPMIGTYYRKPAPDKPNYVEIGDEITPGKVVCIIEAMKLFNEIESEVKGKIVKILVEDASPVEYDQPLYLVEPI